LISQHSQQRTGADLTHKNVRTVQRFDPAMLHQNPFITIDLPALPTAHRRWLNAQKCANSTAVRSRYAPPKPFHYDWSPSTPNSAQALCVCV